MQANFSTVDNFALLCSTLTCLSPSLACRVPCKSLIFNEITFRPESTFSQTLQDKLGRAGLCVPCHPRVTQIVPAKGGQSGPSGHDTSFSATFQRRSAFDGSMAYGATPPPKSVGRRKTTAASLQSSKYWPTGCTGRDAAC